MRFQPDFLDNARDRVPVSVVVRQKVRLRKAGREWVGLCPFHHDTKPSLTVNDQKNLFHCFPCGATGDQFGFLMQSEGLTFPEAVERLASMAGLPLPTADAESVRREARRLTEIEANDAEQAKYLSHLPRHPVAVSYLAKRGIDQAAIEHWGIGYAVAGQLRDRITFPLRDFQGRLVGFAGRTLGDGASRPKTP